MNFWDRYAGVYDLVETLNGSVYLKIRRMTERLTPKGAGVLDCAAGTGALSISAAKRASEVLCTDYSEKMQAVAKRKAKALGITNIRFGRCDIFEIDAPDETYDVTIAGNVLHLLDDPGRAVRELARVTKRGGRILVPCFMTAGREGVLLKVCRRLGYNGRPFSPEEYCRMLAKLGLGKVKAKLIKGFIPCCYAVIFKK